MRWRMIWLTGSFFALCMAAFLVAWLVMSASGLGRPNIDWHASDKIKPGMTLAEVNAILGGPSGDYTDGRRVAPVSFTGNTPGWIGELSAIFVNLDENDKVVRVSAYVTIEAPSRLSYWERLCAKFGL